MLVLATTHDGDIPIASRDHCTAIAETKEHLSAAVQEVMTQLREHLPEEHEQRIAVFDSGGYSQANMKSYHDANIWWISRVPETSTAAKTALEEVDEPWQPLTDGSGDYVVRTMDLPQGKERWAIMRTHAQVQATKEQMEKKGKKIQQEWEKRLWHLSKQSFACETDAHQAWEENHPCTGYLDHLFGKSEEIERKDQPHSRNFRTGQLSVHIKNDHMRLIQHSKHIRKDVAK
jgi:transposase